MRLCMIPAAGSRSSVCMYTPARKSLRRRLAFLVVVPRLSGVPRSQLRTRWLNSTDAVDDEHREHRVEDQLPHARDVDEDLALHVGVVVPLRERWQ